MKFNIMRAKGCLLNCVCTVQASAVIALFILSTPVPALAYIGPGAGFAFLGSAFVFVLTLGLALLTVAFWPLQWGWRKARGFGIPRKARARRVVVVGLDGLEPSLVDRYMSEGKLPNLKAVAEAGSFERLKTTLPALSPVAWSTFQTGVNPGAHNIFDFLTRDKRFCLPQLSSTETATRERSIGFGRFRLRFEKAEVKLLRRSQPFWKILGKHGVFSNILRVPISYPPEKFNGNILSAMCTPDLRGTQGTFTMFTTRPRGEAPTGDGTTGGEVQSFTHDGTILCGEISGPPDPRAKEPVPLKVPFKLTVQGESNQAIIEIANEKHTLKLREFSPWITLEFKFGWRKKISGICRFCLRETAPDVSLYVSPINVNPEQPALPIASPVFFSTWIAKRHGPFGTLGLMEDTWGRNEFALDDSAFLEQAYLTHNEREKMFFDALDKTPEGLCVCVFDASDRIQHMFWRYLDDRHPSPREHARFTTVIPEMYAKMDELIGKVRTRLNPDDVLVILSDHGFSSFRRCVGINTWLMREGYLVLKQGAEAGTEYFRDVDWNKTSAYAIGLSGIYINREGRERFGIVSAKDAEVLKREISAKLEALRDPLDGAQAIRKMYDTQKVYQGLYTDDAPDLIVGYAPGYRVSWESVKGVVEPEIFCDNLKAWSGDHHIDPEAVPGILITNWRVKAPEPHIVDLAPTMLNLFAIPVPSYMEGKVLL